METVRHIRINDTSHGPEVMRVDLRHVLALIPGIRTKTHYWTHGKPVLPSWLEITNSLSLSAENTFQPNIMALLTILKITNIEFVRSFTGPVKNG